MKLLNLDSVKPATRAVTLNGKNYPVKSLTCGLFIAMQSLKGNESADPSDQITSYIEIVEMMIPTMSKKIILGLDFDQVISLVGFVTDSVEEDSAKEAEAIEGNA